MTADEEIISDYERNVRDVRDGILEGLFILGCVAVCVFAVWVFA